MLATLNATRLWKYDLPEQINPGLAEASPGPSVREVIGAMLIAARLKFDRAVPAIRELESSPIVLTTVGGRSPYEASPGGVRPGVYQNLTVRQTAQLCLRRLALRPGTYQATKLYRAGHYWQPPDPLPFQRERRAGDLKPGMIPERVLEIVGAPDFIINVAWEYDLDGDDACTRYHLGGQRLWEDRKANSTEMAERSRTRPGTRSLKFLFREGKSRGSAHGGWAGQVTERWVVT